MKKLSDFKNERGIEVAADVLSVIMDILSDSRNARQVAATTPLAMFSAFMRNSPSHMKRIFAILSEVNAEDYDCNGAQALENMLIIANDPIIVGLFISQSQTGDATSSGSASASTEG